MEQRLRMAQKSQEGSHKRSRRYPALSWRYHCGSDAGRGQAAASSAERQPDPRRAPYETTARRGGLALCAPQSYFAEHQKAEGSAAALTLRIRPLVVSSEARRERAPGPARGGSSTGRVLVFPPPNYATGDGAPQGHPPPPAASSEVTVQVGAILNLHLLILLLSLPVLILTQYSPFNTQFRGFSFPHSASKMCVARYLRYR